MIKIAKIIPGGMGLGTDQDGRKVFFWNALPGESVTEYEITKQKSRYLEAIATKIESPSPHRVDPKDPCFLSTSPWQIMDYSYELAQKQSLVVEIFREHGIDIATPDIITDHQDYHYRNKMEYALYWNNQTSQIELAFHQRGSHRKIPITKSSIERPELFQHATKIIDDLNSRGEPARKYQTLLLRCNQQGQVSGGLYENGKPHPEFPPLTDTILGHAYSYSPNGFFQINLPVYELALQEIKKHISTDQVLDLYAGVGTIGLSVAPTHHLTLVEIDRSAFNELAKNCEEHNDIVFKEKAKNRKRHNNIVFEEHICRRGKYGATEARNDGPEGAFRKDNIIMPKAILDKAENTLNYINYDQTVILDPPRAGCAHELIDKLLEVNPQKIIYLSCNPATQARDVKSLLEAYRIDFVKTFNFFPHTPHIENLVILSRQNSK